MTNQSPSLSQTVTPSATSAPNVAATSPLYESDFEPSREDWREFRTAIDAPEPLLPSPASQVSRKPEPICLSQVNQGRWCQETYESASRHAAIRARALRKLGYRVSVSSLGPQVTGLGILKLTMVDIRPASVDGDTCDLPPVKIERTR